MAEEMGSVAVAEPEVTTGAEETVDSGAETVETPDTGVRNC